MLIAAIGVNLDARQVCEVCLCQERPKRLTDGKLHRRPARDVRKSKLKDRACAADIVRRQACRTNDQYRSAGCQHRSIATRLTAPDGVFTIGRLTKTFCAPYSVLTRALACCRSSALGSCLPATR